MGDDAWVLRLLRYTLLWLVCTCVAVTVGFLAVGFVVDSTTRVPPTVQADAAVPGAVTPSPTPATASASPSSSRSPSPNPQYSHPRPIQTRSGQVPAAPNTPGAETCSGGVGAHTINSQGGQATVRFGSSAVCLIAAVPALGFTTLTQQPDSGTLLITFCGPGHRSQITAHLAPEPGSMIRETSWSNSASSMCE